MWLGGLALVGVTVAAGCPSPIPDLEGFPATDQASGSEDSTQTGVGGDDGDDDGQNGDGQDDGQTSAGSAASTSTDPGDDMADDDGPDQCGGGLGLGMECDEFANDCPDCFKCVPYGGDGGTWDDNACAAIQPGASTVGQSCSFPAGVFGGVDSCDADSLCWQIDFENEMGTCLARCSGTADRPVCPDPGTRCLTSGDSVAVCVAVCDPVLQDCGGSEACYISSDGFPLCAQNASGGKAPAGTECEFLNACNEGLTCIGATNVPDCMGTNCCSPFCDLDMPDACDVLPGTSCAALFASNPPPGLEDVGVCASS